MRKETVDIIEDLLAEVTTTINIDRWVSLGLGIRKAETCDTSYIHECMMVTIGSEQYRVKEVKVNEYFVIHTEDSLTDLTFEIKAPSYFHGKAIDTNAELDMIDDKEEITPLVYFTEIYTDRFYPNDELVERETDIRMFFLTTANYEDWVTNDHYEGVVKPMRNLAYKFIDVLDKSKIIGKFASYYDLTNHPKFGIYLLRKGAEKRIFDDNYSGVEFRIRLPILKDMTCEGFCE